MPIQTSNMPRAEELAAKFESADMVTIKLEDGSTFYVHKPFLCTISPYFEKALEGSFVESQTQTLTLPGCDRATFSLFLHWLCTSRAKYFFDLASPTDVKLASLFAFAEMTDLPRLQKDIIDYIDDETILNTALDPKAVAIIFNATTEEHPARAWLLRGVAQSLYEYQYAGDEAKEQLRAIPGLFETTMDMVMAKMHKGHKKQLFATLREVEKDANGDLEHLADIADRR